MEAYIGSGGIAPFIHNLGARRWWYVSLTPQPLDHQGQSFRYLLKRRRSCYHSRQDVSEKR